MAASSFKCQNHFPDLKGIETWVKIFAPKNVRKSQNHFPDLKGIETHPAKRINLDQLRLSESFP